MVILYNGELKEAGDVRISPDDRAYYFGDGVYEVFRIYGGKLFERQAHLERLERSAREIRLAMPYSRQQLEDMLDALMEAENVAEGILYLQISRGIAPRAHAFPESAEPVLYGYCRSMARPLDKMQTGIDAVTADDIRWLRCDIKSLNLLPNVLAKQLGAEQGAGETILHRSGTVTECSSSNVMIVKSGTLFTHPANHLILNGVTRNVVLNLAREADIPVREQPFTLEELRTADEVFITGTTVEVTPVVRIDGRAVAAGEPGPVTRRLQQAFERLIDNLQ